MQQMTDETLTRPLVKDMDEQARIAYLAGLVGQHVRYATLKATMPLLNAFGEYATIPWLHGVVERLGLDGIGKSQVVVKYEQKSSNFLSMTFTRDLPRFDDLYDMQAIVEEPEPTFDPRGFGCDDLFQENEIGCPHCGHKLRVTLTATVAAITDDDEDTPTDE